MTIVLAVALFAIVIIAVAYVVAVYRLGFHRDIYTHPTDAPNRFSEFDSERLWRAANRRPRS